MRQYRIAVQNSTHFAPKTARHTLYTGRHAFSFADRAMSTVVTEKLHEQFDAGLVTRADFTIEQPLERYSSVDHGVWQQLYARQTALLRGRVCEPFLAGIDRLGLARTGFRISMHSATS